MSAVSGYIKSNQDENTEKGCFSLRNVLLVSGSLVALTVVLVIHGSGTWASANGDVSANVSTSSNVSTSANGDASTSANVDNLLNSSSQSTHNSSSGSDMFILEHERKVYAVNLSDSKFPLHTNLEK